jgi:hypothetical protein
MKKKEGEARQTRPQNKSAMILFQYLNRRLKKDEKLEPPFLLLIQEKFKRGVLFTSREMYSYRIH